MPTCRKSACRRSRARSTWCCTSIRRTARPAAPWSPPTSPITRTQFGKHDCVVLGVSRDDCLTHADFRDRNGVTICAAVRPGGRGVPQVRRDPGEGSHRRRAPRVPGALDLRHRQERRHPPRRLRRQSARPRRRGVRPGEAPALRSRRDTVVSAARRDARRAGRAAPARRPTSPTCTAATASCSPRSSARSRARRRASRSGCSSSPSRRSASTTRTLLRVEPAERYGDGIAVGMEVEEDAPLLHGDRHCRRQGGARRQPSARRNGAAGFSARSSASERRIRRSSAAGYHRAARETAGLLFGVIVAVPVFALSPAAEEFMAISKELEPVQCEKRRLRREIAFAEAERRDQDVRARARSSPRSTPTRRPPSSRNGSPSSSRASRRAAIPRTSPAISLQQSAGVLPMRMTMLFLGGP